MTRTSPFAPSKQPAHTALGLAVKDELRTLGANLQQGAQWLVQDVGAGLAKRVEVPGAAAKHLDTLHRLVDSAARETLSRLESVQHRASATVLDDAPYRSLQFQLQPLAAYFMSPEQRHPSRLFTDVFYWLIRHALALSAATDTRRLVRQQAVDEAYWRVLDQHAELVAELRAQGTGNTATPEQAAALCVALLQALLAAAPVADASRPPWADAATAQVQDATVLRALLAAVMAAASAGAAHVPTSQALACLHLGAVLTEARLPYFEAALRKPGSAEALAAEFAFVFRHV